jgi:membrane-associated phospholipid phosphatase
VVPERGVALAVPSAAEVTGITRREPLRGVDLLLSGYLAIVSLVALSRVHEQPLCWWLLLAHGLFAVFLIVITRPGLGRVGRTLREIYPLLLLVGLYGELDVLNGGQTIAVHDGLLQHWELTLFGSQISRTWWESAPSRLWSWLLHSAYFSYYFVVSIPAFYFIWRDDLRAARHFVLAVMTTFVLCYLVFIFFPVAGPYYLFPRPPEWFIDNGPARLVYQVLAAGSSYGAAFPSSHVAATVAAAIAARRGSPKLGLAMAIPTFLLIVGVVYCQMHYGVDAVAGMVVGVVTAKVLSAKG